MGKNLEQVITWLEAGEAADYRAGVLLLQDHGHNRSLVNLLLKKESAANREKLVYELVKLGCGGRMGDVKEVMSHFAQAVRSAVPVPAPEDEPVEVPEALALLSIEELENLQQRVTSELNALPIGTDAFKTKLREHYTVRTRLRQLRETLSENQEAAAEVIQLSAEARAEIDSLTLLMQQVYNQRCQLSNSLAELPEADGPQVVAEVLRLQEEYNALSEKRRRLTTGQPVEQEPAPASADAPAGEPAPVVDRAKLIEERGNLRSRVSKAKKAADAKPDDQLKAEKLAKLQAELEVLEMQIKQLPTA
jgi:hypothetical protein